MCTGVNQGTEKDFYYVLDQANKTNNDDGLKRDLLASLACSKSSLLQRKLLDNELKYGEVLTALINVVNQPNGFEISWNFLKENWDEIYSKFIYIFSFG